MFIQQKVILVFFCNDLKKLWSGAIRVALSSNMCPHSYSMPKHIFWNRGIEELLHIGVLHVFHCYKDIKLIYNLLGFFQVFLIDWFHVDKSIVVWDIVFINS